MEANDMVEMRGVLEKLRAEIGLFYNNEWIPYDVWQGCDDMISHALAKPPRNCDVGTVEEQKERFDAFCNAQPLKRGYCDCVLQKNRQGLCEGLCEFAWAQTPYAEEGARK